MNEIINLEKCVNAEIFLEMLDDCILTLENMRERIKEEIYHDELQQRVQS